MNMLGNSPKKISLAEHKNNKKHCTTVAIQPLNNSLKKRVGFFPTLFFSILI